MFASVMTIFIAFAAVFILFDDFDRAHFAPFSESGDWHLLIFSLVVMIGLGIVLYRYAHRMDERISREQAEKETQMRRELIQNISHELKTPVASIQGYCETLLEHPDIDPEQSRQFISRTHQQAMRLSSLLQDLSMLNRMDYAAHMFTRERVNVSKMVAEMIREIQHLASGRNVTLSNCLPENIILHGDEGLLYSIFRNLMDNAINYAGEGTIVEISADEESKVWRFTVSDNGQGIASEHLPRIFERFYRIDKGRSRSLGGTGLGLSIVKNAVQLHGGTIIASATVPHGLTFTFTLLK